MEITNHEKIEAAFILKGINFSTLDIPFILVNSAETPDTQAKYFFEIVPEKIAINNGCFINSGIKQFPRVSVKVESTNLLLTCGCQQPRRKLCSHQVQVLYNIHLREALRIFFDDDLRIKKMREVAQNYGLEKEPDLSPHFELIFEDNDFKINPRIKSLLRLDDAENKILSDQLLPVQENTSLSEDNTDSSILVMVFMQHKFYKHFKVGLYKAQTSINGKIKNPLNPVDALELAWKATDVELVKFYTAVSCFQNPIDQNNPASQIPALLAIVRNPLLIEAYHHNPDVSENITANALSRVRVYEPNADCRLLVQQRDQFYELSAQLVINDKLWPMHELVLKYNHFIFLKNSFYLIADPGIMRVINFFNKNQPVITIHASGFESFRKNILEPLGKKVLINYSWTVPATVEQLKENGFNGSPGKMIYLSDAGNQVSISPVMRYGDIEIPVLSKLQAYARDARGNTFVIPRLEDAEIAFTALLLKQHPEFYDQLHMGSFYLSKKDFLDEHWFLNAFQQWEENNIAVFGFKELSKKRLDPHKAKVKIIVNSGLDWFDTDLDVRFGKQKASLRHLRKAAQHRSKFVQLDDGSFGIIPADWLEKFAAYFETGEIEEDMIRTRRINFNLIAELYEPEMLSAEVKERLTLYASKLKHLDRIQTVQVPLTLRGTLRDYQHQGLNWLNFLDDTGFGGCLADDMGLGKTIQVLAFLLLLKEKRTSKASLVVVPTSLVFNWQEEVAKFAPTLKMLMLDGSQRIKDHKKMNDYDLVLTSYGRMVSGIHFLKKYSFHYIFLDESQNIKNPGSQRYKAAMTLQSYNKIVLTGTPLENNTLDLFGQFSFACPGLLGNQKYFKDVYTIPIDKFGDSKRAMELQKKIHPFILRRTKKQVAGELPDKTEMVVYCEMGMEQRTVYDAYEKEFRNYLLHRPEEDLPRERMNILQGLTKLRQICDSPALLNNQTSYGGQSAKINVLVEQIESKHPQHKILVFSQFVSMLELVKNALIEKEISFEWLTGRTKNRGDTVNAFQKNESCRVFLISLKAGGTGLNLTEADYVYLLDPWWNPAVENQAIDRSHRIGQTKKVVAVRLICPGTIEEKIRKLQDSKNALFSDLVKTDQLVLKNLSKTDLLALVS